MKTKFNVLLALFMALVAQISFAQDNTVTGTVTDQDGLALPGVNVAVKGTNSGTQTDFDGNYTIAASQGDVLIFSYVGFTTQEVTVGSSNSISVSLAAGEELDEVVVVGYGTATKQSFAGTASTVDAEQLQAKSYSNVSQSLAGEAAGVTVVNTSGQPGTVSTVRIRGYGSINGNRDPLYVVDGIPLGTTTSLNSINPADIASTTILKDATATAIYGSRGANGVVLITTKQGKSGQDYIEVDVKTGVNTQLIDRYNVIRSPEEYIGYVWEGIYNRGVINEEADPVAYANQNLFSNSYVPAGYNMWNVADGGELIDPSTRMVRPGVTRKYSPMLYEDAAFDSAIRTEGNVRLGGGNDKTKYFISAGFLSNDGYALNTSYERASTRINVTSELRDWLTVGANVGYAYSESLNNGQTVGSENLFEFADKMAPIFPVFLRDDSGNLVPDEIYGGNQYDYGTDSGFRARPNANNLNPIGSALYDVSQNERHDVNGNLSLDIKFNDNLTFETKYGGQVYWREDDDYRNPYYGGGSSNTGDLYKLNIQHYTQNFLQLLRYKNQFGDHSIEALVAHENNEIQFTRNDAYKGMVVLDGLLELDNFVENLAPASGYKQRANIESYFGQLNYDFQDKYYFTGSVRRDGSSRFVNDPWGTFGSAGVAWVASNEDFLSGSDLFTFLKLKASYGVTGDQSGVDYYATSILVGTGILGGDYSVNLANFGNNPDLTWEESQQLQAGVEFSLGNFLDGSFDYYRKLTDNQFFDVIQPPSKGIETITQNDGVLLNEGLEFDLTGHLVNSENFKLDLNVNGAFLNNEIDTMPLDSSTGLPKTIELSGYYGYSQGSSIFDFYMREWAGVDSADGAPMWYQYFDDQNTNGVLDEGETSIQSMQIYLRDNPDAVVEKTTTKAYSDATNKYVGKSGIPDVAGAFRLSGSIFKNLTFSTQFTYSLGGWAYDAQYGELMSDRFGAAGNNFHRDIAARWQQPGDVTDVPRLADGIDQNSTSTSTRFLTKSDYIALNNARIGYSFTGPWLEKTGLTNLNLYLSGDNLYVKTARAGFNPSTRENGNSGRRLYAPMSTFTMGVRARF